MPSPTHVLIAATLVALAPRATLATPNGTIFSGPTSADTATVYWNPAAMTLVPGTGALIFGAASAIRLHYWRDTPNPRTGAAYPRADLFVLKPDPGLSVVTSAGLRRWRFGLGVAAPFIDGATWEPAYGGEPSSTRYHAIEGRLAQLYLEPAVAFRATRWLAIGVGLDVTMTWINQSLMTDFGARINQLACTASGAPPTSCLTDSPLGREDPTYQALTEIGGVGWGVGVYAGVLLEPLRWLRIGASFHSGAGRVSVPVDMKVELPQAVRDFVSQSLPSVKLPELSAEGTVELDSPWILTAGVAATPTERLELAVDLQWIHKSALSTLLGNVHRATSELIGSQVLIKAWRDDFLIGVRGAFWVRPTLRVALRVEIGPNTRPERYVTPVSVDLDKVSLHLGASWRVGRRVSLHAEYAHYFIFERDVRHSNFKPNALPTTPEEEGFDRPSPTGTYRAESDRFGLGLALHFE